VQKDLKSVQQKTNRTTDYKRTTTNNTNSHDHNHNKNNNNIKKQQNNHHNNNNVLQKPGISKPSAFSPSIFDFVDFSKIKQTSFCLCTFLSSKKRGKGAGPPLRSVVAAKGNQKGGLNALQFFAALDPPAGKVDSLLAEMEERER